MKLKKAIGKMGNLAKSSVEKTSHIVREGYEGAKRNYPEVKRRVSKAAAKANTVANKGMDYAVRVRNNTSESPLFREPVESHGRHEESERFFMGPTYEQAKHRKTQHKRSGQTIVINVNSRRKKKRQSRSKHSGFSLI